MADSRTELVLQAIVAALDGTGKPDGVTVDRFRRQAATAADLPLLSVYPLREEVVIGGRSRLSAIADRWLTFQVRCRAAGEDDAIDSLRQWTLSALRANPSLGGLALELEEQATEWQEVDASEGDYSEADMTFRVRFITARGDLTQAS